MNLRHLAAVALLVFATASAFAEVTPVGHYRLGEGVDGAKAGEVVAERIPDSVEGGQPLERHGTPVYAAVEGSDATKAADSTLAVTFDAENDYLRRTKMMLDPENFGIECFVKANSDKGFFFVVSYGAGTHGFSLVRNNNGYQVLLGGVALVGWSGEIPRGQWVHLAVVRQGGKTGFYLNGQHMGGSDQQPNLPGENDGFAIGASGDGKEGFFSGDIDEVRVFTFQPGQFQPSDLLIQKAK